MVSSLEMTWEVAEIVGLKPFRRVSGEQGSDVWPSHYERRKFVNVLYYNLQPIWRHGTVVIQEAEIVTRASSIARLRATERPLCGSCK